MKDLQWKEKQVHDKFATETKEVRSEEAWAWIWKGYLKKETEALLFCSTRADLQNEMDKNERWCARYIKKCWMFAETDEPMNDLITEGTKPSWKEWK